MFPFSQKFPLGSFQAIPTHTQGTHSSHFHHCRLFWAVLELHIDGITRHVLRCRASFTRHDVWESPCVDVRIGSPVVLWRDIWVQLWRLLVSSWCHLICSSRPWFYMNWNILNKLLQDSWGCAPPSTSPRKPQMSGVPMVSDLRLIRRWLQIAPLLK